MKGKKPLNILTHDELIRFFNKYNINELKLFDIIFKFAVDYKTDEFKEIKNMVYNEKISQISEYKEKDSDVTILIKKATIKPQGKKRKLLSQEELTFLYALVENANVYLASIVDDNKCDYSECVDVSILLDSLVGEFGNRKMIPTTKHYVIAG